jgi:VIT1/CCC1 family predicted Fe2+/Mn2+ transporter
VVIIGGLAELFSGAISMGLGAYLAAVTEADHYQAEEARERREIEEKPEAEEEEIYHIMGAYCIGRDATKPLVESLKKNLDLWIQVGDCTCASHLHPHCGCAHSSAGYDSS